MFKNAGGPPSRGPFFLVLAILALALTWILGYQYFSLVEDFENRRVEELRLRTEALAVSEEALITNLLNEIDRTLQSELEDLIARGYAGGPLDEEVRERLLFRTTAVTEFMIMDGAGTLRAWTGDGDAPVILGRQMISEHRERGDSGPILSSPFRETFDSRTRAGMSRSLPDSENNGNDPQWALVAIVDLARFADTVDVRAQNGIRSTSLIGEAGHVYFRRPEPDRGPTPIIEEFGGEVDGEPQLTSRQITSPFDGQLKVTAELASSTWPVVVRVTEDLEPAISDIEAFRRREAVRWSLIAGAFVLLLVALALSAGRLFRVARLLSEREARLRNVAMHDGLTGLATRMLVTDRLEQNIVQAARADSLVAVVYIDLDKFKPINDTLGHAAGDEVLKAVAKRMSEALRKSDTLGRIGGDEFIAVLSNIADSDSAVTTAEKLVQSLNGSIAVEDTEVHVGASAGVALYPEHGTTVTTLINAADHAMYDAKQTESHVRLAEGGSLKE